MPKHILNLTSFLLCLPSFISLWIIDFFLMWPLVNKSVSSWSTLHLSVTLYVLIYIYFNFRLEREEGHARNKSIIRRKCLDYKPFCLIGENIEVNILPREESCQAIQNNFYQNIITRAVNIFALMAGTTLTIISSPFTWYTSEQIKQ